ncbi:MAG: IS66 family insertion sequence element accessory protein TnpB [Myxococcales bacterium]|nr:IS66 family insertion sequence element accessory protein TnpB [Myxococcales bacterium]
MDLPKQIFVATCPVDMRLSFDRLAGLVRTELGGDPRGEALFVFHNKRRTHVKLLWHDGSGYLLLFKRLDRRRFRIPMAIPAGAASVEVAARELRLILEGVDAAVLRAARRTARAA